MDIGSEQDKARDEAAACPVMGGAASKVAEFECVAPMSDTIRVDEICGAVQIAYWKDGASLDRPGFNLGCGIDDVPQLILALTQAIKHHADGAQSRVRTFN